MDKLNLPTLSSSPRSISPLHNSPKIARKFKSGSPNNYINNTNNNSNATIYNTNGNSANNSNPKLDWVKEEAEWEQCSMNPEVARYVKTRNLLERNRLKTLSIQLDKQLERELKRLSLERQEFSDVLENLRKLRGRIEKLNVRSNRRKGFLYRGHDDEPLASLFPKSFEANKHLAHGIQEFGTSRAGIGQSRGSMSHVSSFPDLLYSGSLSCLKRPTPAIRVEPLPGEDRAEDDVSVSVGSDTQSCRSQPISSYWAPYDERSRVTNSASSNTSSSASSSNRLGMRKSWTGDKVLTR